MTKTQKDRAKRIAGEIILDEINSFLDDSESPVEGGRFKAKKVDDSPSDLFEDGFLRNAIEARPTEGDSIEVGVFSDAAELERIKAYAHNTGFKDHPTLESPKLKREFIPRPNQKFKESITKRVNREIKRIRDEAPPTTLAEQFNIEEFLSDSDIIESVLSVTGINLEDFL